MSSDNKTTPGEWVIMTLFGIVLVLLIAADIKYQNHEAIKNLFQNITGTYQLSISIVTGILTGIISAIGLLHFQNSQRERQLNKYYSTIEGEYIRTVFGKEDASSESLADVKKRNEGLPIILKHVKGSHSFNIYAGYWRQLDDTFYVNHAIIDFDRKNKMTATGLYKYLSGEYFEHSGQFEIYKFPGDKKELLVKYHHLFPRNNPNSKDNNRGWEIWQWKSIANNETIKAFSSVVGVIINNGSI